MNGGKWSEGRRPYGKGDSCAESSQKAMQGALFPDDRLRLSCKGRMTGVFLIIEKPLERGPREDLESGK